MATLNRKARRAAAVTSAAGKSKVTSGAGKIAFDATRPLVRRSIAYAVAQGTTVAAHAIVEQFHLDVDMCNGHQATPAHAREFVNAIRKRVAAERGEKFTEATPNRVHEYKKVLSLHAFACVPNLIGSLRKFKVLTFEDLYNVASWMIGSKKVKAGWRADVVGAPTADVLASIIKRAKKRATKSTPSNKPKPLAVGMPTTDPKRGALHIVKCGKAWLKANPEANAGDRALLAAIIRNGEKLASEAAPRIVKVRAAAAATTEE